MFVSIENILISIRVSLSTIIPNYLHRQKIPARSRFLARIQENRKALSIIDTKYNHLTNYYR